VEVLTNLNHLQASKALGERIMDRLKMVSGIWVNFDWESYRSHVKHVPQIN